MQANNRYFSSLGILQFEIEEADPLRNILKIEAALHDNLPPSGCLVILPELWTSGFSYQQLEAVANETEDILRRLTDLAQTYSIAIGGSLVEKALFNGERVYYNTLCIVGAQSCGRIRKQHLFPLISEDEWFTEGVGGTPIKTANGMVGGMICYDLRFPESARRMCRQGAEVLAVAAQWPKSRMEHWRTLLRARAIENQIYTVACNALGSCLGVELGGGSLVVDPLGKVILDGGSNNGLFFVDVDGGMIGSVRSRFNTIGVEQKTMTAEAKCVSMLTAIERAKAAAGTGLKVVYVELQLVNIAHTLDQLAKLDKQYDLIIVGVSNISLGPREDYKHLGCPPKQLIAALAAVDLMVDLDIESEKDQKCMKASMSPVVTCIYNERR